jgi:hypothetical protein
MDLTPGSGNYRRVDQDDPDLLFDRSTRTKVRVVDGQLQVVAWLADETLGPTGYIRVHDMTLRLTCTLDTLTILEAVAEMAHHPHGVCPLQTADADSLVGLSIGPGYFSALRQRMGGVRGCNHLHTLAQSAGTAAALTFAARRVHAHPEMVDLSPVEYFQEVVEVAPAVVNSCHAWREDGEIVAHLKGARSGGADE